MKKVILCFLLFMSFGFVKAQNCEIVSGNGTNIGDIVSCAGEEFYVLENDGESVKMLAKYNLFVGDKIDKDEEFLFETYKASNPELSDDEIGDLTMEAAIQRNEELKPTYGDNAVLTPKLKLITDVDVEEIGYFSRIYTPIEYTDVKQDSRARGLTISDDFTVYPMYGSTALDLTDTIDDIDASGDLILEKSDISEYIVGYENYLKSKNININKIELIKKSGLEKVLSEINGSSVSLENIFEEFPIAIFNDSGLGLKVNIRHLIPEKYSWLYLTTYWIGTANIEDEGDDFLSTNADYCSAGRGCNQYAIGIGVRPVITVNSDMLKRTNIDNPKTADNLISYIILCVLSLSMIILGLVYYNKYELN